MKSSRAHTRIIQHPFATLIQGARLDSFYEHEQDLFLYVQGLQVTTSELFEQEGRILERVTGTYIPLRLHFSGVSERSAPAARDPGRAETGDASGCPAAGRAAAA